MPERSPTSPSPHRARIVSKAVILGMFTTIAISWLAMFLPWDDGKWYGPQTTEHVGVASRSDGMKTFQISRGRNAWRTVTSYWWMQISGQSFTLTGEDARSREIELSTLPSHLRPKSIDDLIMLSWYHENGWPMPAMTCGVHWENQILNSNVIYNVTGGVQLPRDAEFNPRALPLTPLWPGFAVNVLLHACALWILMWSIGAMRRRHRMKRNRCVSCGYSREGLQKGSVCPECGDKTKSR